MTESGKETGGGGVSRCNNRCIREGGREGGVANRYKNPALACLPRGEGNRNLTFAGRTTLADAFAIVRLVVR